MKQKPIIGILLGDASGVGPELVAKLAARNFYESCCRPLIIGDARVFQRGLDINEEQVPYTIIDDINEADWSNSIPLLDQRNNDPEEVPMGAANAINGKVCGEMLITAAELTKQMKIDGFCFAPLNKSAMIMGGYKFESEQQMLAHYLKLTEPYGEINMLDNILTTRVTSHIPVKNICQHLTKEAIITSIKLAYSTSKLTGIENPRIGIAALNPHAGENGLCGTEELEIIAPAIEEVVASGIDAVGPYSADTLFIKAFNGDFNAAVTMYHDQGQIALKLKGFEQGITISGGFPIPITTCAHGTAYDIAGKGIAKTTSFENAVRMASKMAANKMYSFA